MRTILAIVIILLFSISAVSGAIILIGLNSNNPEVTPSPSTTPLPSSGPTGTPKSTTPPPSETTATPSPTPRPAKILSKQIPANYVMGFAADVGLITGTNVVFINDANPKASIRFTTKLGGEATKIVIHAFAYTGQPSIRVGLQEDNGGAPAGAWIKESAFATSILGSDNAFVTLQLRTSVSLTTTIL